QPQRVSNFDTSCPLLRQASKSDTQTAASRVNFIGHLLQNLTGSEVQSSPRSISASKRKYHELRILWRAAVYSKREHRSDLRVFHEPSFSTSNGESRSCS